LPICVKRGECLLYSRLDPGRSRLLGPPVHAQEGIAKIRTFLISCAAAAVIASVAAVILYRFQEPAEVAFSTSSVRI
jgi:hypothetical protein